ncbi:glycosyltransferase family 2 protein [Streptomyces sp. RY43-2]|uniref:Glycosyltransferase family 2 protein n=1 Tax=Streptomyces macrolidinus TaxID=2952607 RepID=A0ABT0ZCK5_9ACTN|nr:glycosyltransferase family A protein [Streptomyces macrolidinus]MCN9241184.1 glycosyltransferase family 2 protein [Streptomyces macrolidinus]
MISIITPVHDGGHQYLSEAYASLTEQTLPQGWSWEWIVQEDGRSRRPLAHLPDDPRVRYAVGRRGGAGVARTLGLARATGSVVRALDADDLLTEGALQRDIEELTTHPHAGWCVSGALDLLPDGRLVPGPYDPLAGALGYETLREAYEADRFPIVGTHLAARTDLVRAVGGWPALPALEALALVLICAAVAPGRMLDTPGGIYRKHNNQTTAHPDYWQEAEFSTIRTAIVSRLDSLQHTQWHWTSSALEAH